MSIDRDNPKWTAYVLGELNETERAALESELESSEEAREFIQELQLAASMMKEGLAAQVDPALTPEQRVSIHRASVARPAAKPWFGRAVAWAGALAAAALVVATISVPSLLRSRQSAQEIPSHPEIVDSAAGVPQPEAAVSAPARNDSAVPAAPVQFARAEKDAEKIPLDKLRQEVQSAAQIAQADEKQQKSLALDAEVRVRPSPPPLAMAEAVRKGESAAASAPVAAPAPSIGNGIGAASSEIDRRAFGRVIREREEAAPPPAPPAAAIRAPLGLVNQPVAAFDAANQVTENSFVSATQQPLSTFSVDVDTASYANVRRFLNQNQMPPRDAVRIEEMINYFTYDYPQAAGGQPVTGSLEIAAAPWNPQHRLVRVGVKAKDVRLSQKPSNLVFLIDVSGSMGTAERLPLLKSGLHLLVDKLTENDRVSIVTYAGASGIALQPVSGDRKDVILRAIDGLRAEGSTNGGAGIQTAYELAVTNFIPGSVNRVILATDGDFNVGVTDPSQLTQLIEDRARSGVFLTVLGFGNNFKDSLLGRLAQKGHGNYAFVDSINEARKVLVEQIDSTLVAVAKDVKVQVEFNPAQVNAYRLLGYESRLMRAQDFNNDQKDANDMGSGQTVTAFFEVVPRGIEVNGTNGEPLRYQPEVAAAPQPRNVRGSNNELLDLRIRYKEPDGKESKLLEVPMVDRNTAFANASTDFRFAGAVAGFGLVLRDSSFKGSATLDWVLATAQNSRGVDKNGYRDEFIRLVQRAMQIRRRE
jgi:Ca-activated chloride channel family protein